MNNKMLLLIFLFLFATKELVSQTLEKALTMSKENKQNLTAVLNHYEETGEKEKYKAAEFLITNMPIHFSLNYRWYDVKGNKVDFHELDYPDFEIALNAFNRIKDSIQLIPKEYIEKDINVMTSQRLIENIDLAFDEWRSNPWSISYTFETFCEYILPYRSITEPLEDWRKDYIFLVQQAKNKIENKTDPTEACIQIINELESFIFVPTRPDPIPFLSPNQMLFRRQGSCPDLANLAVLASRSLGVAVTFDFTPHYAASSNRHYWNTVINKEGDHIPFNSNSVSNTNNFLPYVYDANRKRLGKVFRKTYSIQNTSLATKTSKFDMPDCFLRDKNILDVTSEYVNVSNLSLPGDKFTNFEYAYLNVFNLGKWRVIDWGEKKDGKMVFKDLGRNVVYLPSVFKNNRMFYMKYPILLDEYGKLNTLVPDISKYFSATLSRDNEKKIDYVDYNTLEIETEKRYNLYYWEKGWKKIGSSIASKQGVVFNKIPSNALYKLLPENPDGYERIFTIDSKTNKLFWY